jgi:fatty acid desaturase
MINASKLPPEFLEVSNRWAVIGLMRTWGLIAFGVAVAVFFSSWWSWILCGLAVGLAQHHLAVLGHHALHRNLFRPAGLNEFAARYLILAPLGMPLSVTRANHMRHHVYFETPDDYEWEIYTLDPPRRTRRGFLAWLAASYVGVAFLLGLKRVLLGGQRETPAHKSGDAPTAVVKLLVEWGPVAFVQTCILCTLSLLTQSIWAYPLLWFLPMFTIMAGLTTTRACLEHVSADDPPNRLVTFPRGVLQRFVFGPFNFNYHAEHHRHANVPPCNLRRLHFFLADAGNLDGVIVSAGYLSRLRQVTAALHRSPR